GAGLGQSLGYPTANLSVPNNKLLPKFGVYSGKVQIENQTHFGMAYIGQRPTLNQKGIVIEAHIFNFEGNLYDRKIALYLDEYIREDQKFDSAQDLKLQLRKDEVLVKQYYQLN